eukprot:12072498-Alexandrium_andersonii.AAC.1
MRVRNHCHHVHTRLQLLGLTLLKASGWALDCRAYTMRMKSCAFLALVIGSRSLPGVVASVLPGDE